MHDIHEEIVTDDRFYIKAPTLFCLGNLNCVVTISLAQTCLIYVGGLSWYDIFEFERYQYQRQYNGKQGSQKS
jgi:hypothetical protein